MLNAYEIAGMRATSVAALPDTCVVRRQTSEPTLDDVTLDLDPGTTTTIYAGPCRVRARGSLEQDVEVGELHETLGPYTGTLPALATATGVTAGDPNDVQVDDFLTVQTSSDPGMAGRSFRLVNVSWSAFQVDKRLGLEDRQQPPGIGAAS